MKPHGIQLVAELNGCSPNILNDEKQLRSLLTEAIHKCGLYQLNILSHKFDPIGVTVISIINESHVAIHTFPEANHASIDIFHCSNESDSLLKLLNFLKTELNAQEVKFMEISRGSALGVIENNSNNHTEKKLTRTKFEISL